MLCNARPADRSGRDRRDEARLCAEAGHARARAEATRSNLTQAQIAKLFGVTQPRVSDLLRGKLNVFGLDALVNMAAAAGLRVKISIREAAYANS